MTSKKEFNDLMERIEFQERELVKSYKTPDLKTEILKTLHYLYTLLVNQVDDHIVFGSVESKMNSSF